MTLVLPKQTVNSAPPCQRQVPSRRVTTAAAAASLVLPQYGVPALLVDTSSSIDLEVQTLEQPPTSHKPRLTILVPTAGARPIMSKDLEDGEIEDGELPEELAEIFDADDVGVDTSLSAGHRCLSGLNICHAMCRGRVNPQKLPCRKQIRWLQSLTCPSRLSLQQRLLGAL